MIQGESVTVRVRVQTGMDGMHNPIWEWSDEQTVDNVLISPGSTEDLGGTNRPDGTEIVLTAHFPKPFNESLRNKRITVGGVEYAVVGDPRPYQMQNTPTDWWMPVSLSRTDG